MDAPVKGLAANSEKAKALQVALAQIEKQFGKGTIMRLGEGEVIEDIQVVSTGSLGHGLPFGVGKALAAKRLGWGDEVAESLFRAALTMNLSMSELQDKIAAAGKSTSETGNAADKAGKQLAGMAAETKGLTDGWELADGTGITSLDLLDSNEEVTISVAGASTAVSVPKIRGFFKGSAPEYEVYTLVFVGY